MRGDIIIHHARFTERGTQLELRVLSQTRSLSILQRPRGRLGCILKMVEREEAHRIDSTKDMKSSEAVMAYGRYAKIWALERRRTRNVNICGFPILVQFRVGGHEYGWRIFSRKNNSVICALDGIVLVTGHRDSSKYSLI